jgi:hypothetical protein
MNIEILDKIIIELSIIVQSRWIGSSHFLTLLLAPFFPFFPVLFFLPPFFAFLVLLGADLDGEAVGAAITSDPTSAVLVALFLMVLLLVDFLVPFGLRDLVDFLVTFPLAIKG